MTRHFDGQPRVPDMGEELAGWDADSYVELLADLEGTKAHKSIEGGQDTRAYGVKFIPPGVDKNLKGRELAVAVAGWHQNQAQTKLEKVGVDLGTLPTSLQTLLVDLHYNTGSLFNTTPQKLAQGDLQGAVLNTLDIFGATENGKQVTYAGLAVRRAKVANAALEELGLPPIAQVTVRQLDPRKAGGARTEYQYIGADGSVLHSRRTARPLSQTKLGADGTRTYQIGEA